MPCSDSLPTSRPWISAPALSFETLKAAASEIQVEWIPRCSKPIVEFSREFVYSRRDTELPGAAATYRRGLDGSVQRHRAKTLTLYILVTNHPTLSPSIWLLASTPTVGTPFAITLAMGKFQGKDHRRSVQSWLTRLLNLQCFSLSWHPSRQRSYSPSLL